MHMHNYIPLLFLQSNQSHPFFNKKLKIGDKDLLDIVMKKPYLDVNLRNNNNKLPY